MVTWLVRRSIQAMLVVLAMTIIVLIGVNVIGNPLDILISPQASAAERTQVIPALGLDQPLWRQYVSFLSGLSRGDLGGSFVYNEPALGVVLQRAPATMKFAIASITISVLIGVPAGLYAGLQPNSPGVQALMAASILGFSLPSFWVGLMLIMVFAVQLGWLPSKGRGATLHVLGANWSFLTRDGLAHLALPATNLALFNVSLIMRLTRAGVREALPSDYVRFARAKGLYPSRVIGVHVMKNIMISIVTVVGLELGSTIAFSVVTESIFAWRGMGKLIIDSINQLDRPVIVAYLMLVVVLFLVINLAVDLIYTVLDPRVRLEQQE